MTMPAHDGVGLPDAGEEDAEEKRHQIRVEAPEVSLDQLGCHLPHRRSEPEGAW